jgi:hypothetical protein
MNDISPERLEACRAYVQSVIAYGDDLSIILNPAWFEPRDGKAMICRHLDYYANNGAPEPSHSHEFSAQELIAVLGPLGKVHDWAGQDAMAFPGELCRLPTTSAD